MTKTTRDATDPERPRPGRRRDPVTHQAILHATVELLVEVGYQALSIEEIARRAGTSKATIYRWWDSKPLLVYEAAFTQVEAHPIPDTGSLRSDLRALGNLLVVEFNAPAAIAALPGLLADFASDAVLANAIRERFLQPTQTALFQLFERARERGEIGPDVQADLVLSALAGTVFWRTALTAEPMSPALMETLIDLLGDGLFSDTSRSEHHGQLAR